MSHKWTANAYSILAERAMEEARVDIQSLLWIISHDNRLHNQSHFISGCAATVWVLPADAALPVGINGIFQAHHAQGLMQSFLLKEVLDGNPSAHLRIKKQFTYHILHFLLSSPDFADYADRDHEYFNPLPAVHCLPYGPDHIVKQCILRTIDQEEATKEEFFCQLGIGNEDEMLRGLFKYRYEDFNSFDRMDYMIPVFGWFHLVMAFANLLHKQYLGIAAIIRSLQQAFDVLQRKGLHKVETKGPFWHHLHKALHHIGEAHICATWLAVAGVSSLSDLKTRSPAELHELAIKLVNEQASRKGHAKMMHLDVKDQDACGDVGQMEDMLPTLLFRFVGRGNAKYMIEVLELMQGLKCEWPMEVK
ncbi:hypothetical protein BDN67DRAFT_991470 [Paxillus ammoniavirescens]|nr:hypothetical protein BDN67DRAFT_991470 [Paxillus ammoniavirescens]